MNGSDLKKRFVTQIPYFSKKSGGLLVRLRKMAYICTQIKRKTSLYEVQCLLF